MELSSGQFLPPVQKLVATTIAKPRKRISNENRFPSGSTITHRYEHFWFRNVFFLTIENAER